MIFEENLLVVRELSADDYPTLSRWLTDPRVLEFYEGRENPHNLDKVTEVFGSKQDRCVMGCIVRFDEKDIGYIQFYPVSEAQKSEYGMNDDALVYGMDQFIGEPEYWNRGIGSALVKAAADFVRNNLGASKVVVDPQAWNARALRCYEKAGFRKVKWLPQHELHEGEWRNCWLMEFPPEGAD